MIDLLCRRGREREALGMGRKRELWTADGGDAAMRGVLWLE